MLKQEQERLMQERVSSVDRLKNIKAVEMKGDRLDKPLTAQLKKNF